MAEAPQDVEQIRRQMAQIRMELHQDMQGVVRGTEAATNWQYYVRHYPWPSLALALAVGYLIVPRRHRSVHEVAEEAAEEATAAVRQTPRKKQAAPRADGETVQEKKKKAGLMGIVFGFLGPIVLRAAQSYAAQYVENFIATQGILGPDVMAGSGGPPPSGPGGGRAGTSRPS